MEQNDDLDIFRELGQGNIPKPPTPNAATTKTHPGHKGRSATKKTSGTNTNTDKVAAKRRVKQIVAKNKSALPKAEVRSIRLSNKNYNLLRGLVQLKYFKNYDELLGMSLDLLTSELVLNAKQKKLLDMYVAMRGE